jgi:hypothetical protein
MTKIKARKIGILTIHHHENDGSVMQAFCVKRLLGSVLPDSRIEYVNVFPEGHAVTLRQTAKRMLLGQLSPARAWVAIQRTRSFAKFSRTYLQPKGPQLITNNTVAGVRYLNEQGYSGLLVGSDTVWELGNRWCGLPPPPNYYFTPGLDSSITSVGFAVSCDPISVEFPRDVDRAAVAAALKRHHHVTYRDEPTKALLLELGVSAGKLEFIPDPTLVWDFSPLVQNISLPRCTSKVIGIAVDNANLRSRIAQEVKASGFEVISLLGHIDGAQLRAAAALSVNQRLGLFKCLDALITDRFHASIFTLKLNCGHIPVIGVEDENKWALPNSKLRDLFQKLDIEEFVVRPGSNPVTREFIEDTFRGWPSAGDRVRYNLARLEQLGLQVLDRIAAIFA